MKLSKVIFYFSVMISIFCLIIGTIFSFGFAGNTIIEFLSNILMNIFAGTIVLIGTSLLEYLLNKEEVMEEILIEAQEISNIVGMITYVREKNVEEMDRKNLFIVVQEYMDLINHGFTKFFFLSDKAEFLFDFKDKKKKNINDIFFIRVNNFYRVLFTNQGIFKEYVKHQNYKNIDDDRKIFYIIKELQEQIFYYEEIEIGGDAKWCEKFGYDYNFVYEEYDHNNEKIIIIINELAYDLLKAIEKFPSIFK